jgi:hypothetical protein
MQLQQMWYHIQESENYKFKQKMNEVYRKLKKQSDNCKQTK